MLNRFKSVVISAVITFIISLCVIYFAPSTADVNPEIKKETETVVTEQSKQIPALPPTVKNFLNNALPITKGCLYVWGGGWNGASASKEGITFGPSKRWKELFDQYDYYEYTDEPTTPGDGLDCTGFVGYSVYQTFGDMYSEYGYTYQSGRVGSGYEQIFGGTHIESTDLKRHVAGDVMYVYGHAWICLGECSDGSVLVLHSSPPCVTVAGTPTPDGNDDSIAYKTAVEYMSKYSPDTYLKFPYSCYAGMNFIDGYNAYRFPDEVMSDPENLREMYADEVINCLVGK